MQSSSSTSLFFEVSVDPLVVPCKKPQHLESHFEKRSRQNSDEVVVDHRRQAILQDRKSRLSKRQASIKRKVSMMKKHLEKIQQEKEAYLSTIMDSASKNRSQILESKKMTCAGHNINVQKVKESHYRSMAEYSARLEQQLSARHELVAKRRQRLLSIPRSRLLEAGLCSVEDLKDVESARSEAIVQIQQWWRRYKYSPVIEEYKKLQLSLKSVKKLKFEVLMRKMQSKATMGTTSNLLMQMKMSRGKQDGWKAPTRIFLTCYMLVAHPTEIIPHFGTQEEALQKSANDALIAFESWIKGYTWMNASSLLSEAIKAIDGYFEAFDAWKSHDTRALVTGIVNHWINLERLWLTVREQADAETEWKPKIESQQKDLFMKLKRLGADALKQLEAAQRDLADESSTELADDMGSLSVLSTSPERYPKFDRKHAHRKDSVGHSLVETEPEQKIDMKQAVFGQEMTNEFLAHEVAMDPDFKLKPNELSPLEKQIQQVAKKAFFDAARQDLSNGKLHFVLSILADVKESLLGMVSEKSKLVSEINQALDLEFIEQQLEKKVFDLSNCVNWIISKMLQLCAPMRDSSIREIGNIEDPCLQFEKIMDMLSEMKLDLANFRLESLKPVLKQQAVEYEQTKFKTALEKKQVGLEKTRSWLKQSFDQLQQTVNARNPENIEHHENRVKFEDAFNEACLSMIFSNVAITQALVPETFAMDAHRIYEMQNEIQKCTIISALLMLIKNTVAELRRDDEAISKLKDALVVLLNDQEITMDHLTAQLVSTLQKIKSSSWTEEEVAKQTLVIKSMVLKTLSTKDPVYSLINRRIMSTVKNHIINGILKKESLGSHGLGNVASEIETLSFKICRMVAHNKKVYGVWYDEILRSL